MGFALVLIYSCKKVSAGSGITERFQREREELACASNEWSDSLREKLSLRRVKRIKPTLQSTWKLWHSLEL